MIEKHTDQYHETGRSVGVCRLEKDAVIPSRCALAWEIFTQKNKREATLPSCKDTNLLIRSHGLDDLDLTAIVGTALRAHSVRQMQRTALGACHQTGSRQLPHGAASLIASLLGYFSLRYCHVDTSLVLYCLSSEFIEEFTLPPEAGAWPEPPGGDPPVFCSGKSLG